MKKYFLNAILIFLVVLGLASVFSSLVYSQTSDAFKEDQAVQKASIINQQVALSIDYKLHDDYQAFISFVQSYSDFESLVENKDLLVFSGVTLSGIGRIIDDDLVIGDDIYSFQESFISSRYHLKDIATYRLSDALNNYNDNQELCFFKYDNIIGFLSADDYLKHSFSVASNPKNKYLISNTAGYVGYREDTETIGVELYNLVLLDTAEQIKANLRSRFLAKERGVVKVNAFGLQSFLAFYPLTQADMVILHVFDSSELFSGTPFFSEPIFYGLVILLGCFVVFMVFMFMYLNKRNNDIEISKHRYYYNKPFIFRINKKGLIKKANLTCGDEIPNLGKYKSVFDFELTDKFEDLISEIKKQTPFTVTFNNKENELQYIRFIPIKTSGGHFLLGENITTQLNDLEYHRNMALYNSTTKLPNRNYLGIHLQNLYSSKGFTEDQKVLVAIEINSFKSIQRLFGQKIVTSTLIKASELIQVTLGEFKATLYHVEPERFMVLFTDLERYQIAISWSERLANSFSRPLEVSGNLLNVEVKIGVFELDPNRYSNMTPILAYDYSLLALKRAKESRRTNVVVYDIGMGQVFTRSQAMELDLAQALTNRELKVYYQPQLNTMNNEIIALESLLRWNNPKYALDSPASFIELAEQNNMIIEIGKFVINETFQTAKEFEKYNIKISINISPVQILQSGFVYDMTSAFDRYQLKRNSIVLEITETMLMESFDSILDKLITLKKHGFNIHLDNFGIGYSSMLYLKDLPVDGISISRSFIKSIENDRNARTIVSKIISLANSLEIDIIAEGVETNKQKTFLNQNGCFIIQGFLFSKAVDKESIIQLLDKHNLKREIEKEETNYYDFLR